MFERSAPYITQAMEGEGYVQITFSTTKERLLPILVPHGCYFLAPGKQYFVGWQTP